MMFIAASKSIRESPHQPAVESPQVKPHTLKRNAPNKPESKRKSSDCMRFCPLAQEFVNAVVRFLERILYFAHFAFKMIEPFVVVFQVGAKVGNDFAQIPKRIIERANHNVIENRAAKAQHQT